MYTVIKDTIRIQDEYFDIEQIADSGQVFRAEYNGKEGVFHSVNRDCLLQKEGNCVIIHTDAPDYFVNYFDLDTDYAAIHRELMRFPEMKEPLAFGKGIRILKQDPLETVISFIISANNNIPRIKGILARIFDKVGAFTLDNLATLSVDFYRSVGAGYRAEYLADTVARLSGGFSLDLSALETPIARKELLKLKGIGPKVADCILLFGFYKKDVFPVDTWIKKVYSDMYGDSISSIVSMSNRLVNRYGDLSGYAQQYLYYYYRANNKI